MAVINTSDHDGLQSILVPESEDEDIEDTIVIGSDSDVEIDANVEDADVVIANDEPFKNFSSTHLPANSAEFQCLVCDIQFTRKSQSLRHVLKHIGQPSVVLVRLSVKDDIEYKRFLERNSISEPPKPKRQRKNTIFASETKTVAQCIPLRDDVQINNQASSKKTYSCSECKIQYLHEFLLEEHQQITGHGSYITSNPPMVRIPVITPETMEVDEISKTYSCCDCKLSYLQQFLLEEHLRLTGHGRNKASKPPTVVIRVEPPEIKQDFKHSVVNKIPITNKIAYPMQNRQSTAILKQTLLQPTNVISMGNTKSMKHLFGRVTNIQPTTTKAVRTIIQPTTAVAPKQIRPTTPAVPKNVQSTTASAPINKPPSMLTIRTIRPHYSANSQIQQPSQSTVSTVTMSLPPSLIIRKTTTPVMRYKAQQPIRSALFGHQQINAQPVAELSLIGRPGIRCVISTNPVPVRPASARPTNAVDAQFRLFGGLSTPNMTAQIRQPMLHRPPSGTIIRQHFRPPVLQRIPNIVRPATANRVRHPMSTNQPNSVKPLTVRVRLPVSGMPVPLLGLRNPGQPMPPTQMLVNSNPNDKMSGMIVNQPRTIGMPFIESVTGGAIVKVIRPPAPTPPVRVNSPAPIRLPVVNTARLPVQIRPVTSASRQNLVTVRTPTLSSPGESSSNTRVVARSIFDMMNEHENEGADAEMILS